MKLYKKIIAGLLTVSLLACINWNYLGSLWGLTWDAAMGLVSGETVSTAALQSELNDLSVGKILRFSEVNLNPDDLKNYVTDIWDHSSDDYKTTEEVSADNGYRIVNGYTVKVNEGQQKKHIVGTNEYKNAIDKGETKSIIYKNLEEIQLLLNEKAGSGEFVSANKERVDFEEIIGVYIDPEIDVKTETTMGIIHYGKKGAHIVPARPNK